MNERKNSQVGYLTLARWQAPQVHRFRRHCISPTGITGVVLGAHCFFQHWRGRLAAGDIILGVRAHMYPNHLIHNPQG